MERSESLDKTREPDDGQLGALLAAHRAWLHRESGGVRADLRRAKLGGRCLAGADLREALCSDADFRGADLRGADLRGASFKFSTLRQADLRRAKAGADFRYADLAGSNLHEADCTGANLLSACLEGIIVPWVDHVVVSEILWRAASGEVEREMVAAYIGRCTNLCWDNFGDILPPRHRNWVLEALRNWVRPGDDAPGLINYPLPRKP